MPRYNAFGQRVLDNSPVLPTDFYARSDSQVERARAKFEAAMEQWYDEGHDPETGASLNPCPYLQQFID